MRPDGQWKIIDMAVSRLKSWIAGEVLTATDQNAEFDNILNNGQDLGWPATKNKDLAGYALNNVGAFAVSGTMTATLDSSATNTVTTVGTLVSTSSGTPAAGIGVGFDFSTETAAGNNEVGGVIESVTTDVDPTNEDFDMVFKTMLSGDAAAEFMRGRSDRSVLFSGNVDLGGTDLKNIGAMDHDTTDKGSVSSGTVTFSAAVDGKQKLTVTGSLTIAFSNWASTGHYSEVEVMLVNGGSATVTHATVNWAVGDGTTSTTFSDTGITLASSGTNHLIVWTTDGGTTLYGVAS